VYAHDESLKQLHDNVAAFIAATYKPGKEQWNCFLAQTSTFAAA